MPAVALISDLVMQSQVAAAAARVGVTVEIVNSAEALLAKAQTRRPRLVILDLSHPGLDAAQLVPRLKELLSRGAGTLAFGPHVHAARLAAAREAGCDVVISRGQFHAQMDEILRRPEAGGRRPEEEDEGKSI
jgi:DNA-binding response OmpR family regulator